MYSYDSSKALFTSCCLNITDSCNLACKYCFVHQQPHFMSLETAKGCVDFLYNNLMEKEKLTGKRYKGTITYFGGEPTLCWDSIIVPLTEWIEEIYPDRFNLTITTNGTLLSRGRIDFLREHNIQPLLSMDGDKDTQDTNRPCRNGMSSFDMIDKNLDYLLEKFPETTFRATINQETAGDTYKTYFFAICRGFKNFFITPNCRETWSEENIEILREQVQRIYTHFAIAMLDDTVPINFKVMNETFRCVLRRDLAAINQEADEIEVRRPGMRCGLGTTSASFAWDGSIYGCQEQDSYAGKDSIFYIGNIYDGIDEERHKTLLEEYGKLAATICEDKEYCEGCPMRTLCQELGCPSVNWDLFHDFHTNVEISCIWHRMLFDSSLPIMRMLVEENNQTFKRYLYEKCGYNKHWKEEDYYGLSGV